MRKLFVTFLLAASLLIPQVALAWNGAGHMTVARIAYANLTDSARTRVDTLLRQHPDFTRLSAGLSPRNPDFNLIIFMRAATWPDAIKSDPRFFEDGGTPTMLKAGFPSMERHREWHFIDTPFSTDGTPTAPPPTPNAITELPRLISEIGSDPATFSPNLQAYDLAWLIHLTGDVHQPLHATSRFTSKHGAPEGDRGGNLFKITVPGSSINNLHSFWDDLLGTDISVPSVKSRAASIMRLFPPENPADMNPQDWVDQSLDAAKITVYSIGRDGVGDPRPRVTTAYRNKSRPLANKRAALAGYRLAAVINSRLP
jgi:hypothetical protein